MPSPNAGKEAAAIGKVRQAITILQQTVAEIDPATPLGKAVIDCIGKLAKAAPAAESAPNAGMQGLKDLLMKAQQQNPAALLQRSMASAPQQPQPPAPAAE